MNKLFHEIIFNLTGENHFAKLLFSRESKFKFHDYINLLPKNGYVTDKKSFQNIDKILFLILNCSNNDNNNNNLLLDKIKGLSLEN